MCGIAGVLDRSGVAVRDIEPLLEDLVHRGPDDVGSVVVGDFALGIRRLSIIDRAGGHQPFLSRDRRLAVVGNGEVYNHDALRRVLQAAGHDFRSISDIEVVLHLYEDRGLQLFEELRGMFALAIADDRKNRLILARDRLGIKPLYYASDGAARFAFASEYRALLKLPWVSREPDLEALREFSARGWIAAPRTAIVGVRKLGAGEYLVVDGTGDRVATWWERPIPAATDKRLLSPSDLFHVLDKTVAAHLMSEVPLGIFLSGGLDSSLLAALAVPHSRRLTAFTVNFSGDDDASDRNAARQVARRLGLEHVEVTIDPSPVEVLNEVAMHHDDPLGDPACVPTYLMSRAAREYVTVVLTGEGADEAFGGYRKYDYLRMTEQFRRLPSSAQSAVVNSAGRFLDPRRKAKLQYWIDAAPGEASLRFDEIFTAMERSELFVDGKSEIQQQQAPVDSSLINGALWVDSGHPLSEQLTMKVDKMTMAHSLEARVPFLDHIVVEAAAGMPEEARRNKRILREVATDLLPNSVLSRRKKGFTVPLDAWFRHDLRGVVTELLAPRRIQDQGLWQPDTVVRWCEQHFSGEADRGRQLWNLLAVQLWWEQVISI